MSKYSVGISVDDIIEAEDELVAKAKFFESLSWKQCYAAEIEPQKSIAVCTYQETGCGSCEYQTNCPY